MVRPSHSNHIRCQSWLQSLSSMHQNAWRATLLLFTYVLTFSAFIHFSIPSNSYSLYTQKWLSEVRSDHKGSLLTHVDRDTNCEHAAVHLVEIGSCKLLFSQSFVPRSDIGRGCVHLCVFLCHHWESHRQVNRKCHILWWLMHHAQCENVT